MNPEILKIRNSCAEEGVELTPIEVSNLLEAYGKLKKIVKEAFESSPDFYNLLCNAIKNNKIEELHKFYKDANVTSQDFNDFIKALKRVCELEGYA
jgi:hypothetical protein